MRVWAMRIGAVILLIWCALSARDAIARARMTHDDMRERLESELEQVAATLPEQGPVGYVDARSGDPSMELALHVGQYVLAPRLLVAGSGPEWVIVRTDAPASVADPRLAAYQPVGRSAGSHRLYRRMQ
jgi:hypothetical protein